MLRKILLVACFACLAVQPSLADPEEDFQLCANIANDHAEAIRRCTAAIDSGELSVTKLSISYSNRAYEYQVLEQFDRALSDAVRATEINPKNSMGWGQRGLANLSLGRTSEAVQDFEKTLEVVDELGNTVATVGNSAEFTAAANLAFIYDESGNGGSVPGPLGRAYNLAPDHSAMQGLYKKYGLK